MKEAIVGKIDSEPPTTARFVIMSLFWVHNTAEFNCIQSLRLHSVKEIELLILSVVATTDANVIINVHSVGCEKFASHKMDGISGQLVFYNENAPMVVLTIGGYTLPKDCWQALHLSAYIYSAGLNMHTQP